MKLWIAISLLLSTALWTTSAAPTTDIKQLKNKSDFDKTINDNELVMIKFNTANCKDCKKTKSGFEDASEQLKKDNVVLAEFDCSSNKALCDEYNVREFPTLQVFVNGMPSSLVAHSKRGLDESLSKLNNQQDLDKFKSQNQNAVVAYISSSGDHKDDLKVWSELSEKLGKDYKFALVTDEKLFKPQNVKTSPTVAIYKGKEEPNYYVGPFLGSILENFIGARFSKYAKPLSDKGSSNDKGKKTNQKANANVAVYDVTKDNYNDIVMDTTKDVLLDIYSPSCGHCQQLAPIYEQLGEVLKSNNAKEKHDIVIARLDHTKNPLPSNVGYNIYYYPTIKLFKAGKKEVIDYTGERSLPAFVEFLNKQSSKKTLNIKLDSLPKPVEQKVAAKPAQLQVEKKNDLA